jgi:hypothetical protein
VDIDALPSLRCWAVEVDIGGEAYRIPPLPAADWLIAISASFTRVVPGMLEGDIEDLLDRVSYGDVPYAEVRAASRDAIAQVAGMKWWAAARLVYYLGSHWSTIGGALLLRGADPSTHSIGAVLTSTYRVLLENCKNEQERVKLDYELERPPAGIPISQMYDANKATASFMALANAPGG